MNQMDHNTLTTSQAAELAGVSRATMARIAQRGDLPRGVACLVGGKYVWRREGVLRWLEECDCSNSKAVDRKRGPRRIIDQVVVERRAGGA